MTETSAAAGEQRNEAGTEQSSSSDNTKQMIKRVIGQRDEAREKAKTEAEINQDLLARNALLEQQLKLLSAGAREKAGEPDKPTLAKCGGDAARYEAELARYYEATEEARIEKTVKKQLQSHSSSNAEKESQEQFSRAVDSHYERAQKLGVADYEQAETQAIQVLGTKLVEAITMKVPNSEQLIYMLGSDVKEAQRLKALFAKDPDAATIETGRLSAKAQSYKKDNGAEPESGVNYGGAPAGTLLARLEKELDNAYTKAAETGDLSEVRKIKAKIKEASKK